MGENRKVNTTSKRTVLLIAALSGFLPPFMGSSVNIALPQIGKEFAMDAVLLGWVATSYLLASAVALVPFGRIADIYGRKKIFTCGTIIYTVFSLLSALSTSDTMLISFRTIQGIGSAMIFGTGVAILTSVFPPGERGRALGINVAAVYLGLSLGPPLGGFLTEHFGWRSIFLVSVPLGLITIAAIFWKLKGEWAEARGEKFDTVGSIIYGIALVGIIYGLTHLPATPGVWAIVIGALAILAFIRWEKKVPSPVLNMNLFRQNTVFAFSSLAALISYSATFAVAFLLSLYLQYTKGLSPQYAGLILVSTPAMQAIFSPLAGRLSDKIEPRIIASAGMGLTTAGLVLLTLVNQNTSITFILVSLLIVGLGFALFSSPNTNAIMSSVDKRFYGVASATLATMRTIGMTFSMGIAMLILAIFIGRVEITPEYYPAFLSGLKVAFAIFAATCFGGIFASLARGKIR